ncbi:MAG: hypothetical protein A2750_02330 [Candidatus Yanofskybacteria bacterium RIFCSPHIGHO2_01_FULL_45_42]|uniref:Peptidase S1 domain-containing protein n=2 Tax=Candidatus Yanofskyibacteriota TaxID=1752733 RepID=A0A1F8FPN0_9BACT|nr:MAG: hypothetical protein A2750_02330 [Candidatus Yanofskybacteria bacterium RIFCSPHIGHO2_01_FULL_45_42]OGN15117.1 MAG: hypothetical protein A3J47_00595 [Candidatus Yanofskybacteria bacterium RIFCSPHIGHO2_02_FULL_43_22]
MKRTTLILLVCVMASCGPPDEETNVYRREGRFPGGLNVPVGLLAIEWAGKVRVLGSAWLIDGSNGALFSAKHVTDTSFNNRVTLGGRECKILLNEKAYDCAIIRAHSMRDVVVLKTIGPFNTVGLPVPYKIAETKVQVGDKVFIQGFHPHPREVSEFNEKEGFGDLIVPIYKTFYGMRFGNECRESEIVFDNIEAKVTAVDHSVKLDNLESDPSGELKYKINKYFSVTASRNHKLSFAGTSGGVVVRIDQNDEPEAVGIITAEKPVELQYDQSGHLISPCGIPLMTVDTIMVTPVESVMNLVEYAKRIP